MRFAIAACAVLALQACGNGSSPPAPGGSTGSGEAITGRERIGWTQTAPTPDELASYRYALYVDGQRRVVEGHTCSPAGSGTSADCSAPLPSLGAGRHSLELAAFFVSGDSVVEGPRSPVLQVTVQGVTAPAGHIVQGGSFASSDGFQLRAEILARDLDQPVDLAVTPDGRVFVAERAGRVRILADESDPAFDNNLLADLGEPVGPDGATLLSIALTPDFASSGLLHVAYSTREARGPVLRLARVAESRGVLRGPAILASYPLAAPEISSVLRFGPDRMLYIGIGTEPDGASAQDLAEPSGKILRLREDATTPSDNPAGSPVFSAGHRDPRGLAWLPHDASMWEIERDSGGDELNHIQSGANYGWPVVVARPNRPHFRPPALLIDATEESSGLASVPARGHPLFGSLIVSTLAGRDLLRFHAEPDGGLSPRGRLLQGRFGRIAQVAADRDGAIYAITQNDEEWGRARDVLIRVTLDGRTIQ